jgi:hypothetical protein
MTAAFDFADTRAAAKAAGKAYETFRKIWPQLVRTQGFPAPFAARPYRWEPSRLAAWRDQSEAQRRAALLNDRQTANPANDDRPDAPPSQPRGRVAAGRARIMNRMRQHP